MKKYYRLTGIIILIFILTRIDYRLMAAQLSRINTLLFLLINFLLLPAIFFKALRWNSLLKTQGVEYPFRDALASYLGAIFAGIVTPGRVGEFTKAVYLKNEKDVPFAKSLASIALDRVFDLYLLILIGGIGILRIIPEKVNLPLKIIFAVIFVCLPALFLFKKKFFLKAASEVYPRGFLKFTSRFLKEKPKEFFSHLNHLLLHQNVIIPLLLTVIAYGIYFLHNYLLARLLFIPISFTAVVFFIAIVNLASILPISIFGIGIRDVSLVYFFSLKGLSQESALAYSFLHFCSFYFLNGIVCYFGWALKEKNAATHTKNGRHLSKEKTE